MATSDPIPAEARRFSIGPPRPLRIGVVAAVLIAGAVGLRIGLPTYRQQVAIREIERLGGVINVCQRGPTWLRDRLGDERMKLFDEVAAVSLDKTQATDATLRHVSSLTRLEWLRLNGTKVTDVGLSHLKGLTRLHFLTLDDTSVTNAGLIHLAALPNLQYLSLYETRVTIEKCAELEREIPGLEVDRAAGPDSLSTPRGRPKYPATWSP